MSTKQVEILLVEDNEDDIVILQEAFAESKTINLINIVRDGEEAMTYLRRKGEHKDVHLPGLILLDISDRRSACNPINTGSTGFTSGLST